MMVETLNLKASGSEEVSVCVPGEALSVVDTKVIEATESVYWGSVNLECDGSVVLPLSPEARSLVLLMLRREP